MHTSFYGLAFGLLLGLQSVTALPAPSQAKGGNQLAQILQGTGLQGISPAQLNEILRNLNAQAVGNGGGAAVAGAGRPQGKGKGKGKAKPPAKEQAQAGEAQAGAGAEAGAAEGEAENGIDLVGAFDVAVPVEGGELKQDIQYPPSAVGSFEYEFQAAAADEVTVSENKTPAAPPAGFEAIEPSSFKVSLAQSKGVGLTLSKIDYIFDPASAALAGKDITTAKVGKLCTETGDFIISESLGEVEFELEENEVTLNLNKNVTAEGEWGIFLPIAAAAAAEVAAAAEGAVAEGAAVEGAVAEGAAVEGAVVEGVAAEGAKAQMHRS